MSALAQSDLMILAGVALIASYVGLVLFRKRAVRRESEAEIEQFVAQSLVVRGENTMESHDNLDVAVIEEKLRALTVRSNSDPYVVHYVKGLIKRSKDQVDIDNIKKAIEVVGVRIQLVNKIIEAKQSEYRMRRLDQEEALKDDQVETQRLRERVEQEKLQDDMDNQREIRKLAGSLEKKRLQKQHADFDKSASEPQHPPDPIREYREQAQIKTELKKIDLEEEQKLKKAQREAEGAQESEMEAELQKARHDGYPEAWQNEGKWLENLEAKRDKLAYVDLIIETYEQKKQRTLQKYEVK